MLHLLPVVIWKHILAHIYASSFIKSSLDGSHDTILDNPLINLDILSLRQTCKYIKTTILTPAVCEWVMSKYQYNPNYNLIVAIPRPHRFISLMLSESNQISSSSLEANAYWSSLQWIIALSFTVALVDVGDVFFGITKHKSLSWTVYLPSGVHELDHLSIVQDLELIGHGSTQLVLSNPWDTLKKHSLCLRNIQFSVEISVRFRFSDYVSGHVNVLCIDRCTFADLAYGFMIDVTCKKLVVTNCVFGKCYIGVKMECSKAKRQNCNDVLIHICDNRFENCQEQMELNYERMIISGYDMERVMHVANNESVYV